MEKREGQQKYLFFSTSMLRNAVDTEDVRFDCIPGAKIGHIANHINYDVSILPKAEVVVVMAGQNMGGGSFEELKTAVSQQAGELTKAINPYCNDKAVFVTDPASGPTPPGPEGDEARFLRAEMRRCDVNAGATFIPFENVTLVADDMEPDEIHFSSTGTKKILVHIRDFIKGKKGIDILGNMSISDHPYGGVKGHHFKVGCYKCSIIHPREDPCPPPILEELTPTVAAANTAVDESVEAAAATPATTYDNSDADNSNNSLDLSHTPGEVRPSKGQKKKAAAAKKAVEETAAATKKAAEEAAAAAAQHRQQQQQLKQQQQQKASQQQQQVALEKQPLARQKEKLAKQQQQQQQQQQLPNQQLVNQQHLAIQQQLANQQQPSQQQQHDQQIEQQQQQTASQSPFSQTKASDATDHPLQLSLSPRPQQQQGEAATPHPASQDQSTQEALEKLALPQPIVAAAAASASTDRSRSQSKRRAVNVRSESGKRPKVDANFFLDYQKNAAILGAMGMTPEQQLMNEKNLTGDEILVKQRSCIEWYKNIHPKGRGGSAPPSGGQ